MCSVPMFYDHGSFEREHEIVMILAQVVPKKDLIGVETIAIMKL